MIVGESNMQLNGSLKHTMGMNPEPRGPGTSDARREVPSPDGGSVREQLKKLDIGRWRSKTFTGERILTLEEVLDLIAGNIDLCLEIKSYPDSVPGIELKLLFILSHYDYLDRTVISASNYRCLARVRELAPEAALGVIHGSSKTADPLSAAKELGAASIHVRKELASREFLQAAWDEGIDVYVWTVNEVREMEAFVALGVQGLISDYPEKLWKVLAR